MSIEPALSLISHGGVEKDSNVSSMTSRGFAQGRGAAASGSAPSLAPPSAAAASAPAPGSARRHDGGLAKYAREERIHVVTSFLVQNSSVVLK